MVLLSRNLLERLNFYHMRYGGIGGNWARVSSANGAAANRGCFFVRDAFSFHSRVLAAIAV